MKSITIRRLMRLSHLADIQAQMGDSSTLEEALETMEKIIEEVKSLEGLSEEEE